jgi:hypothetical protein
MGPCAFGSVRVQRIEPAALTLDPGGAGIAMPILATVTGGSSPQDVLVPTTQFLNNLITFGATFLLIDAENPALQEVVKATVTDSTHFNAILFNNHAINATVRIIYSVYTKYLLITHVPVTGSVSLTNIGFIRGNPTGIPNVFDQYRLLGSPGTIDYEPPNYLPWYSGSSVYNPTSPSLKPVPIYSSSSISSTGNPTNALLLNAGPVTGGAAINTNVEMQILCTTLPEVDASGNDYRTYWDH